MSFTTVIESSIIHHRDIKNSKINGKIQKIQRRDSRMFLLRFFEPTLQATKFLNLSNLYYSKEQAFIKEEDLLEEEWFFNKKALSFKKENSQYFNTKSFLKEKPLEGRNDSMNIYLLINEFIRIPFINSEIKLKPFLWLNFLTKFKIKNIFSKKIKKWLFWQYTRKNYALKLQRVLPYLYNKVVQSRLYSFGYFLNTFETLFVKEYLKKIVEKKIFIFSKTKKHISLVLQNLLFIFKIPYLKYTFKIFRFQIKNFLFKYFSINKFIKTFLQKVFQIFFFEKKTNIHLLTYFFKIKFLYKNFCALTFPKKYNSLKIKFLKNLKQNLIKLNLLNKKKG